jgi:Cu-Zn family superoxide dismutase
MNRMKLGILLVSAATIAACAHHGNGPSAMAMIAPASGSTVQGMIHFNQMGDGQVQVVGDLSGLTPGMHGFHVHEKGDCGNDAQAAGGHFNPMNAPHASPDSASHHAGDFGNVTADAAGNAHVDFTTHSVMVGSGTTSVVNRAVVVHADPDDLNSQPSGNAGKRVGCGVVSLMNGSMPNMH